MQKTQRVNSRPALFNDLQSACLHQANQFDQLLMNLRFEGKASFGRNLMAVRKATDFFRNEVNEHIAFEESIIFPYLVSHLPKLDFVIHVLQSEHEIFKKNFEDLKLHLSILSDGALSAKRLKALHKLQEVSTCLVYLVRNHIWVESKSVYELAERELRPDEKKNLEGQMKNFSKRFQEKRVRL